MKLCIVAVILAIGCSKKESVPKERPTVTDPIGFCERERAVMMHRRPCFPEDQSIKMGLAEITETERTAPDEPEARRRAAVQCAVALDSMIRAEQPQACPLDVTDGERAELAAFLGAWYGQRTPPTADPAVIKLAAQRDAACACKDLGCHRKISSELDGYLAGLSADTAKADRDASTKMIDELARCKQRLMYGVK
jgi:hypothetical protein